MLVKITPYDNANHYFKLLKNKLESSGFTVNCSGNGLSWQEDKKADIIHLHWLHPIYWNLNYLKAFYTVLRFLIKLTFYRAMKKKIIWTVHNLFPHEKKYPVQDYLLRFGVSCIANSIIVHSYFAKGKVAKYFFRNKKVFYIPYGHYCGACPNNISRVEARGRIGIPQNAFVYLFLGNIRLYKGVKELIDNFKKINDKYAMLILAGNMYDDNQKNEIINNAKGDSRIKIFPGFIPDDEIQFYFNASDVSVFPYNQSQRSFLTSGALNLALSFGMPVIAPNIGYFAEILNDEIGLLYNPEKNDSLLAALNKIRKIPLEGFKKKSHEKALSYNWDEIAKKTIEAYKS